MDRTPKTQMEEAVRKTLAAKPEPDTLGNHLQYSLESCDPNREEYRIRAKTDPWMRNPAGTVHGGMCAALVDQAMGVVACCICGGRQIAPTVGLQLNYHRPLIPGEDILIRVQVISVTASMIHLTAAVSAAGTPEKICVSGAGSYFCKQK